MKKNLLKKLGAVSLVGVLGVSMSGCFNKTAVDQEKLNILMEDMQAHLDSQKEMTTAELNVILGKSVKNLIKVAMDHNYTYQVDDKVVRVEYLDTKTKVHFYTLNDNGQKTKEVYREIHDDYVYTYVKDLNRYSKIPVYVAKRIEGSLLTFVPQELVAIYNENDQTVTRWNELYVDLNNTYYYLDLYEALSYTMEEMMEVDDRFLSINLDSYKYEEGKHIFNISQSSFIEGDNHDFQHLGFHTTTMEITDKSYVMKYVEKYRVEGTPDVITSDSNDTSYTYTSTESVSFDKENTIDFNTVGYNLATKTTN